MNALLETQRYFARKLDLDERELGPERSLQELGIDSLAALELLFDLEEQLGLRFHGDHSGVRTLGDVVALVEGVRARAPLSPEESAPCSRPATARSSAGAG
jgi:acyl carrier protein